MENRESSGRDLKIRLNGQTGRLLKNVTENWLLKLRKADPAILTMFRDRDVKPYRDLLPWSGEFAGKHLTGAYYVYRLTEDPKLYEEIREFIRELLKYQDTDGYLGCFSKECRLTGAFSQDPLKTGETWDSWNHYHVMFGLYLWYRETKEAAYLEAVEKAAGLFLKKFYNGNAKLSSIGSCEMNLSVLHIFVLLYEETGKKEYLTFAHEIEKDLSSEEAGGYIENALEGKDFYLCRKPRWESLHVILGILELYAATGKKKYLEVSRQITDSILRTDVHNTGAFSTDEQAIGHPFKNGNIETCCVVAFDALLVRMYELTDDVRYIDALERAHYNAMLGAWSPEGYWSTYNTPMDGVRRASADDINFQCRPGSPDLNCCSVNAPRGIAEIGQWAATLKDGVLTLNLYEAMHLQADGIELEMSGIYPAREEIQLRIHLKRRMILRLRVPSWSKRFFVNRKDMKQEAVNGYLTLRISSGETCLTLRPDFSIYTEAGEKDYEGCVSVFMGPLLLGVDSADNPQLDLTETPALSAKGLALSPFYSLGNSGSYYRTWLKNEGEIPYGDDTEGYREGAGGDQLP